MAENLYRIIDFPSFVNLITTRRERLVHPTQWEDTYEGIFFSVQKNPEKCELLLRELCDKSGGDLNKVLSNFVKCLYFPLFSYAQCWCKVEESDAMWRIYNYGNMSVQICTTEESWRSILQSQIDKAPPISDQILYIDDVKYDLDGKTSAIINMLQEKALTGNDLCDLYFHKRPAFKHEDEKRVLVFDKAAAGVVEYFEQFPIFDQIKKLCDNDLEKATIDIVVQAVKECLSNNKLELNSVPEIDVNLDETEFKNYIKSVKLHPFAPAWIDDLVRELCQRNGLNYVGKSKLYTID